MQDPNAKPTLEFSPCQLKVFNEAYDRLHGEPWFTDIAIDSFPTPQQIGGMGFEESVVLVVQETRDKYQPEPGED